MWWQCDDNSYNKRDDKYHNNVTINVTRTWQWILQERDDTTNVSTNVKPCDNKRHKHDNKCVNNVTSIVANKRKKQI